MDLIRRISLLLTAIALAVAVLVEAVADRPGVSADAASSLERAASYFDSTVVLARNARPRGARGDQLAIGLGYLERLRLGIGSPFRLTEEALRDPRLDPLLSSRVAWALLARLRRGDAYVADPVVLDAAAPSNDEAAPTGSAQIALIEDAVRAASDPRAGELAVRLAYMIASAKGTVPQQHVTVAAQVAALARDRELAMLDLRDLLSDANDQHVDVMTLLVERRAARQFRVEQPALVPLSEALQTEAMRAVPALVAALDTLHLAGEVPLNGARASLINKYFAERLAELAAERPPLAQVGVTLKTRAHVTLRSTNDEMLVGDNARGVSANDTIRRANALAMLSTAVSMRTLAQSAPWFPGDRGPDAADLTSEFGLADVTFSRGVPAAWRPYYLRELQNALRDMQLALPALSVAGLHVRIGNEPLRDSALAMHDPRTRTLQLSIATSGGTLAHELSHDLDWQAARRLFSGGSGYSSDRAMREQSGALASSLRGLAEARLLRPLNPTSPPPSTIGRPAEMFARGADWFVASVLAQQGRMNGYLTVISDGALAGYAAGLPTAMGTAGASALVSAIGTMTHLPDSIRRPFEAQWADPRRIDPTLLVRRVLETPLSARAGAPKSTTPTWLSTVAPVACSIDDSPETKAREKLLMLAVDARAEGVTARRARYRPSSMKPDWVKSVLGVAPWSRETAEWLKDQVRAAILSELSSTMGDQGLVPLVPEPFCTGMSER